MDESSMDKKGTKNEQKRGSVRPRQGIPRRYLRGQSQENIDDVMEKSVHDTALRCSRSER